MTCLITSHMKSIKAINFGWVSEGFPRNIEQLNKFKNDKLNPDLVIYINNRLLSLKKRMKMKIINS